MQLVAVEYLRKADETLEIYTGNCNNVWVHNYRGYATIFADVQSFARYVYKSETVPRKTCTIDELDILLKRAKDYEDIKLTEDRT